MPKKRTRLAAALEARTPTDPAAVSPPDFSGSTGKEPTRVMYIESKAGKLTGTARIGRVTFSKTWKTIYYRGKTFRRIFGGGFKSNYYDKATGEDYWISGPKKNGNDRLYGGRVPIEIDEDVRAEYWREIRKEPEKVEKTEYF
jgi:hypothetical protein